MERAAAVTLGLFVVGSTLATLHGAAWNPVYGLIGFVEAATVAAIVWAGIAIVVERRRRRASASD